MILEKLKTWQYYEALIPLYFRNSNGTCYHFKILVDLLEVLDELSDIAFNELNITEQVEGFSFDVTIATDILDNIGSLLGISRYVHVKDLSTVPTFTETDLTLSNSEFLDFIKTKIALNSYDGTRENAIDIYEKLNLPFYMLNSENAEEVYFYIDTASTSSNNIVKLVMSGLMTLESIGVKYVYSAQDISLLAYWDTTKYDSNRTWGI